MSHTITHLPELPIVVAKINEEVTHEVIKQVLAESKTALRLINGAACLLLHFAPDAKIHIPEIAEIASRIAARVKTPLKMESDILYAIVGVGDEIRFLGKVIERENVKIPIFENDVEAISFLNLKLDTQNLKASRLPQTADLEETIHRYPDFEAVKAALPPPIDDIPESFPSDAVLRFEAIDFEKSLVVHPKSELYLGRKTKESADNLIDFSYWAGYAQGLSRRHAVLSIKQGRIFITDLYSMNGTFLNKNRLEPDKPYPVHNGDTIHLGELGLRIRFLTSED